MEKLQDYRKRKLYPEERRRKDFRRGTSHRTEICAGERCRR